MKSRKTIYRFTAQGGLAYYEELPDNETDFLYTNTDEGCFIWSKSNTYAFIMLDPGITSFSIDIIEAPHTVTFSAEGASDVPEPITKKGISYIPNTVPQKENMEFYGWKYTYTFRGKEYSELLMPDSTFLAYKDTVLTAEFERLTILDKISNWLWDHIFEPQLDLMLRIMEMGLINFLQMLLL